jgi:lipoate---protein ligase
LVPSGSAPPNPLSRGGGRCCERGIIRSERRLLLDDLLCLELSGFSTIAENLALDEALLIEADAGRGGPVLRFWEPVDFGVVLGASCRVGEDVLEEACRADGVPILRRTSGGGTVVVGPGALNVSVILPDSAAPGLTTVEGAHRYVLDSIARRICGAGPTVTVAGRGDLVIGNQKCGGSAQRRLKSWFMVHCSILNDFSIDRVVRYLAVPRRQPDYRQGRGHHAFLRNLGLPRKILQDAIRGGGAPGACPAGAQALVPALMAEKFANRVWIERF